MSRSYTPVYRIEAKSNMGGWGTWGTFNNNKERRNLEEWRECINNSFKLGGVNEHLSESRGFLVHISAAKLINQKTSMIVEETKAPMFEVV